MLGLVFLWLLQIALQWLWVYLVLRLRLLNLSDWLLSDLMGFLLQILQQVHQQVLGVNTTRGCRWHQRLLGLSSCRYG
jgi:hypothetical protein